MVPPSFIRRLAGRKGDAAKFINKDAPTTGASLSVGGNRRHVDETAPCRLFGGTGSFLGKGDYPKKGSGK